MVLEFFLKWVQTARVGERAAAAAALARAYCQGTLALEERCAAEAAMVFLLDDPSSRVRAALGETLSLSPRAPAQVVAALAGDQADVAAPVVARSPVLSEAQLIDIFAVAPCSIRALIAARVTVSMPLAAAIAELGDAQACLALLRNEGADVASVSFGRLVERFAGDAPVREALTAHPDLPPSCRHALLVKLGDVLKDAPFVVAMMGQARAERAVREACQRSSMMLIEATPASEHAALVEHLRLRGELTHGFLVRAVAQGRIDFFGAALVALTGRAFAHIRAALAGGANGALRALFSEAGLAAGLHGVILRALKIWREVAQSRRSAGVQEVAFQMLEELGGAAAAGELATLLRRIHLDAARANARSHALALAAA
jgi:uncharacterized protein (DUF2336 family)